MSRHLSPLPKNLMERHIPNVDESLINATELIVRPNIKIPSKMFNKCEKFEDFSMKNGFILGVITNGCDIEFIKYLSENNIKYTSNCIYEYNNEWLDIHYYDDIFKYTNGKLIMLKDIDIIKFLRVVNELYTLFPDFGYTPICSKFHFNIDTSNKSIKISNHEGYNNFEDIYKLVIYLKQNKIQIPNILKHFYIRYYNYE